MKRLRITLLLLLAPLAMAADIKPGAEVTAAKSPIQLTLRLYKTTVKVKESLWYQIELKNVGKKRIHVLDNIFKDPWQLKENSRWRVGIYLEVIDPDGEKVPVKMEGMAPHWDYADKPSLTPAEDKELAAVYEKAKREGLDEQHTHLRVLAWNGKWNDKKQSEERSDRKKWLWLKPGESIKTLPWAYQSEEALRRREPAPKPIGDFAQLWMYLLLDPGRHKIRAVYDYAPIALTERLDRKYGIKASEEFVRVKTAFVPFGVEE